MPTKRQYKEALRIARGVYVEAARILGVSRQAVRQYCESHPDLEVFAESFVDEMLDNAEANLARRVEKDEFEAIKLAFRYYGHRRGLIERKEFTGEDGKPILSEGTTVKADTALLVHTDEGQKFLELLTGVSITKLLDKPPREESD